MNPIKSLFRLFSAKTNTLVVSNISALDNYNLIARRLIDGIERLDKSKNANTVAISDYESRITTLRGEADEREVQVKALLGKGVEVDKTLVVLILRKRQLADGFQSKADQLKSSNDKIRQKIVQYGDKLENLKHQLELARLEEDFKKEGIALPKDVEFDAGEMDASIDRLTREVDMFTDSAAASSVTTIDVDAYLESLK